MQRRFAIILGGGRSARMGRDKRSLQLDGRSLLARAVDACAARELIIAVTPDLPDDVGADRVTCTLEDPPFGGPVAGIAAGMAALPPAQPGDEVLLLACDLPHVAEIVAVLDAAPLVEWVETEAATEVSTSSTSEESKAADEGLDKLDQRIADPEEGLDKLDQRTADPQRALDQRDALDCVCLVDAEGYPQYLAARYHRAALDAQLAAAGVTRSLSVRRLMAGLNVRQIPAPGIAADVDTPDEARAAGIS
ncbi:molybdenum cofactor guanylyltransferase [Micropruina sp.]|uniref:molybdenum cofactor guanylyltransferase n=1 Tax=Micropruina sp. TaxID=2737536 RepID=UPI0039E4AAD7